MQYMKSRGYATTRQPSHITFTRGSLWGSLTSFNPAKWKAKIGLELRNAPDGNTEVTIACDVNTTGQRVLQSEIDFWNAEVDGLAQAIATGVFNLGAVNYTERQATSAGKRATVVLIVSILIFSVISVVVPPLIEAVVGGMTWEDLLRTDTIALRLESILLPVIDGPATRLVAAGAILVAVFILLIQPMRQSIHDGLNEMLQTMPSGVNKPAHVALDALVVILILVVLNVSYSLVKRASLPEQQTLT